MKQNRIRPMITPIGVLLILIFFAACSPPSGIDTPTLAPQIIETQALPANATATAAEPAATPEGNPPVGGVSLCTNLYYPVREGATWIYKSTGSPAGEYSFTDTVTSVRADGFTLSTQIGSLTRTQVWTCSGEGLAALQLGGAPAAMLSAQNIQLDLDVTHASGVTFPSQINSGDQWQQMLDVEGSVRVANEEGTATGTAQMDFNTAGNESVTVPAGTFEALKIEVNTTLDVDVRYEGLTLPVTFSGAHTYWFVQGVGWVKSTGTGSVLGSLFDEATELQSYNVP